MSSPSAHLVMPTFKPCPQLHGTCSRPFEWSTRVSVPFTPRVSHLCLLCEADPGDIGFLDHSPDTDHGYVDMDPALLSSVFLPLSSAGHTLALEISVNSWKKRKKTCSSTISHGHEPFCHARLPLNHTVCEHVYRRGHTCILQPDAL